jgi:polar amino acid transport system permease protein
MHALNAIKLIRPSNLVILGALPFIAYVFATSPDYQRAARAILGIDPGSSALVPGFLLLTLALVTGLAAHLLQRRGQAWVSGAAAINILSALAMRTTDAVFPFARSIVANAVDPFTSDWVVRQETPRRLTDEALAFVDLATRHISTAYLLFCLAATALLMLRRVRWPAIAVNGIGLSLLYLFAYIGFAAGVAVTLRAAVFAYAIAITLGFFWVSLLRLQNSTRGTWCCIAATAFFAALALWFLLQPAQNYVLVGSLDKKVAVLKGTPSSLVTKLRYGQFDTAPGGGGEIPVKTYLDAAPALEAISTNADVSGALIPSTAAPEGATILWRASALSDQNYGAGIAAIVAAIVIGIFTFGGILHGRHPLSVAAEFFIDTIRGIPMLVIVLYVGLPLSGVLKDSTSGLIDPPNFLRGVVAMGLAYSAYLAEIMRSGIKAIPFGQLEAAQSFGFTRWQVTTRIIVPQAFRIILPALGNELIAIIKDTSLLSILSIRDITQRTREFQSASFLLFAPFNSAAIFYIVITLAAASILSTVEKRYDLSHR